MADSPAAVLAATKTSTATGAQNAVPADAALPDAIKIIGDVMKNEETRFSNLNTRAVAVLSATSLITGIFGVFSKDLFGDAVKGHVRTLGGWGLTLTVGLLLVTGTIIVVRVLAPGRRLVFGNNDFTNSPAAITTSAQANARAYTEYLQIFTNLVERNKAKAEGLNQAYGVFLAALLVGGATTILVVLSRL